MILGITGSIGSGKTTVARLFSRHDFKIIDADEIAHKLQKSPSIYKKLREFFGDGILDKNMEIDRSRLGDIAFSSHKKLKKLNSIMHPAIIREINQQKNSIKENFSANIIIDAPLMLEVLIENDEKAKALVDKVVLVKADKKDILKRLKGKYPREKLERILSMQMPLEEKLKYSDFVIDNSRDIGYLKEQVKGILKALKISLN